MVVEVSIARVWHVEAKGRPYAVCRHEGVSAVAPKLNQDERTIYKPHRGGEGAAALTVYPELEQQV